MFEIRPLEQENLSAIVDLLDRALPDQPFALVAHEKFFGSNGSRHGESWGAWQGANLAGVLATAGRWIKMIAVDPAFQRQGLGAELLAHARLRAPANQPVRLCDHPGNYFTPGIDENWLAAHAWARKNKFVAVGQAVNLIVDPILSAERVSQAMDKVTGQRYRIRRLQSADAATLFAWVERTFSPSWAHETRRAFAGPHQAVHAIWKAGQPVAFACADGNNRGLGWFGPAGTEPAHQRKGLGEILLFACLQDVVALPQAGVIAWAGSKPFYEKVLAARIERTFVQYELSL